MYNCWLISVLRDLLISWVCIDQVPLTYFMSVNRICMVNHYLVIYFENFSYLCDWVALLIVRVWVNWWLQTKGFWQKLDRNGILICWFTWLSSVKTTKSSYFRFYLCISQQHPRIKKNIKVFNLIKLTLTVLCNVTIIIEAIY